MSLTTNSTFLRIFAILALFVSFAGCNTSSRPSSDTDHASVVRTGKIRAAYAIYPPLCLKNSDGSLGGIGVEILEEAARRLELKVEWTEEVGWGTIFEGLESNRYDIFGTGVWQNASRGRSGIFSHPFLFNAIKVWGRPGLDLNSLADINRPEIRISAQDGAMEDLIAKTDFPSAKKVSLPQLSPWSDVLLNVSTGKADITFGEPAVVLDFLKNNPGTLKPYFPEKAVRVFPTCYAIQMGEFRFQSMIDSALVEMHADGSIDKILAKHESHPGIDFYRVANPYKQPSISQ